MGKKKKRSPAPPPPKTYTQAVRKVTIAMSVRKYFWRQAWLFNIIWFVCYGILLVLNRPGQQAMPDMIWQG